MIKNLVLAGIASAVPFQPAITSFGPDIPTTSLHLSHPPLQITTLADVHTHAYNILKTELSGSDLFVTDAYQSSHSGTYHVYMKQKVAGMEVANAYASLHIAKDGSPLLLSHSFFSGQVNPWLALDQMNTRGTSREHAETVNAGTKKSQHTSKSWVGGMIGDIFSAFVSGTDESLNAWSSEASPGPETDGSSNKWAESGEKVTKIISTESSISAKNALERLAEHLSIPITSVLGDSENPAYFALNAFPGSEIKMKLLQTETDLVIVWEVELDTGENWFLAHVDAVSGDVLQLVDWVSHATFTVFPLGKNDPFDGDRETLVDPFDKRASPVGWNTQVSGSKKKTFTTTIGNNVFAQNNPSGGGQWKDNYRPKVQKGLHFDFPLSLDQDPEMYIDASITNLFYWNNVMHDLFCTRFINVVVYGFDEVSGNFQEHNFSGKGKGGDGVIANSQDGSGNNNANFATPPDGRTPRMRMYTWTETSPNRDGDLESGIIIHEYSHGISTRLTGWGESGGMGEGWGDIFATILRTNPNTTRNDDFSMGAYSAGTSKGIRKYIYSTAEKTNPSTYSYVRKPSYWGVHAKGEVWAEILYEVYWNLVDAHGYAPDWYNRSESPESYPTAGNKLALQLIIDGLKLQPCGPSFVDARDAILLADKIGTGGKNRCIMYAAFAKRGLGVAARKGGYEDFEMPPDC